MTYAYHIQHKICVTGLITVLPELVITKTRRYLIRLFVSGSTAPQWARASSLLRFLDDTQRRITVGSTPLDAWSARRRDLYLTTHNTHNRPLPDNTQHSQQTSTWQHTTLTTDLYLTTHNTHNRPLPDNTQHSQQTCTWQHNTHNKQTSMPPVGFEPTISAGERPQTYALDRAGTGTGGLFRVPSYIAGRPMGKDSSPSTGCSLYASAQARSNSRLIEFYFHIVRICKPCIFASKVWLTILIRRSRVMQKTLFVCSFLCLFRMPSKPMFYQSLWDRGPVNSFSTRRGPGPNRFTPKYLSIFLSSHIKLT